MSSNGNNTAIMGTPVANPVTNADIATLGPGVTGVSNVTPTMSQDITTMANAVPHDEFTPNGLPPAEPQQPQGGNEPQATIIGDPAPPTATVEPTTKVTADPLVCSSGTSNKFFDEEDIEIDMKRKKGKMSRRQLSAAHREMIIDLVFNKKKTSREVAKYMGLPRSTVMSVVLVFKKEHRIHKKTTTGRKKRLTKEQELQLFEMSQEHDKISVKEIRNRLLQQYPDLVHISITTILRTLERGKVFKSSVLYSKMLGDVISSEGYGIPAMSLPVKKTEEKEQQ